MRFREPSTHSPLSIGPHRDEHAPPPGQSTSHACGFCCTSGGSPSRHRCFTRRCGWRSSSCDAQWDRIIDRSRQFTALLDVRVFRPVALHTPDGLTLEGVVLAHADAAGSYWVLFCLPAGASIHGLRMQGQLHTLWELGYNVLAFDYRGFGENRGRPSEQGLYSDGATAYG